MSENTVVSRRRQILVLAALTGLLVLFSVLLFHYGRQHRVIIDNRAVELPDGRSLRSLAGALVAVNRPDLETEDQAPAARPWLSFKFRPAPDFSIAKPVRMMPRERILVKVLGPSFNLKAEVFDRAGQSLGVINADIRLGGRRDAMVRLVKLHNGLEDYLEDYPNEAARRPAPEEEEVPTGGEGALEIAPGFGE